MSHVKVPIADRVRARMSLESGAPLRLLWHYQRTALAVLSPGVRTDIARHIHGHWFNAIPFFNCGDEAERARLLVALLDGLLPCTFTPFDTIAGRDLRASSLLFITKGIAVQKGRLLCHGDHIGDGALTSRARHLVEVRAVTSVQCWSLHRDTLWDILDSGDFPVSDKRLE